MPAQEENQEEQVLKEGDGEHILQPEDCYGVVPFTVFLPLLNFLRKEVLEHMFLHGDEYAR